MKTFFAIVKYIFIGAFVLIVLGTIGLFFYYQSTYKDTPAPTTLTALPSLSTGIPVSDKPILLPIPQKLNWTGGSFRLSGSVGFLAPTEDQERIQKIFQNQLKLSAQVGGNAAVKCIKNAELAEQAYRLSVQPNQIQIQYHDSLGLFYALTTLKQLAQQSNQQVPCVQIEDQPDLKVRGVMLDISRNKVPKLETLYEVVDVLADLKYNHLQLYIEDFSFGYPSFKQLWQETETPLLPAEIQQLDAYCRERYIELVPNQNSLGHMAGWLNTAEYKDLAECPEGYKLLGLVNIKMTISPTDPRSLALVKKMSEDLLPNFTSKQFNVNLDEPFELGKSKKRKIDDHLEVSKLYLEYAKKLNTYVNSKGKTMLMWGDVVAKSPEIIPEIPKNITLLEWGYEADHPFKTICPKYQKGGLRYMVCPGTSSWSSFTGRTDNMMANIDNAVSNGIKYGAVGMLNTDWGDFGHLQYLTVSYAGFAYGAALSWNNASKKQVPLAQYLSKAVFKDQSDAMGEIVLELGRYNQFEEYPMVSMTTTSMAYRFGIMDKNMLDAIKTTMQTGIFELLPLDKEMKDKMMKRFANAQIYNAEAIENFVAQLEKKLVQTHLNRPDSTLILDEYRNAIRMIRLGAKLKYYNNYQRQQTLEENKALLNEMKLLCEQVTAEHKRLWLIRNKPGRLDLSSTPLKTLQTQIDVQLRTLKKNGVSRWISSSLDKVKSAAAMLYLK